MRQNKNSGHCELLTQRTPISLPFFEPKPHFSQDDHPRGAWCGALSSFQNEVWALPAGRGGVNSFSASGWGLQMWLQSGGRKSLRWLLEKVSSLIKYVHSETCPSFVRDRCVSCRHFLKVAILVAFSFVNYLTPLYYLHTFFYGLSDICC